MANIHHLERKKAFRVSSNEHTKPYPSIARMFKLIFKRGPSRDKARPNSWAGEPELKNADPLVRHASARVNIPNSYKSSVYSASRVRNLSEKTGNGDSDECDGSWRQRQTYCVNCNILFFTSLSSLSCKAGRFCSLDCKTSFEYVHRLEEILAVHMLQKTSDSFDSSSDEDAFEVKEFDLDEL